MLIYQKFDSKQSSIIAQLIITSFFYILISVFLNYATVVIKTDNKNIFHLHAEVCKTLSNAKRLEILNTLRGEELSFSEIVARMGISKANVSQHLALMKNAGILETRRDGVNIYYRITNPKVIKACNLMREVLIEYHSQKGKVLKSST